jgi:hypothetical protein
MPRPAAARKAVASAVLAALCAGFALAGCERRRFEPIRRDSTHAAVPDSFAMRARAAAGAWEGADGEAAARLTAQLLLEDLRARTAREPGLSWTTRAEQLLDSIGVGAEVESDGCAMLVNLFSRSDPDRVSWPWLFWCGEKTVEAQAVEGSGLRLVDVASRGLAVGGKSRPDGGVAAMFARRAGAGAQPLLYVWGRKGAATRWEVRQTLGADSLGGYGTAEFTAVDSTVRVTARTYRPTPRFEECATCPHVYRVHRFRWGSAGFEREDERTVPSPYATFVRFATALSVGDEEFARGEITSPAVLDAARRLQIGEPKGPWRVAPATDESARFMVFLRGRQEAVRVTFEAAAGDFLISGLEPSTAVIE